MQTLADFHDILVLAFSTRPFLHHNDHNNNNNKSTNNNNNDNDDDTNNNKSNQVLRNMQKSVISSTLNITRTFKTFLWSVVERIIACDV